jgi:peptidoglycan/LPS O-acetylase OafA/YrhL
MVRRLGYVPALDGIRGLLVPVVIAFHYSGYPSGAFFTMEFFFALSGFLITTLLFEERDRKGTISLRVFYRRRAYRLLPGLFTVLTAYFIFKAGHSPLLALERTAAGGLYVTNIIAASSSHLLNNTPLKPYWSLAEEEQFYLLWPLLLSILLTRRIRESRIAVGLGCLFIVLVVYRAGLGLAGASMHRLYFAPDTHSDALVLGCLLAFLRRRGLRVPQWAGWLSLAALIAGVLLISHTAGPVAYATGPMSIAAMLFVGAAVEPGLIGRFLSLRPLVALGVIAYSLYLWHFVVYAALGYPIGWVGAPVAGAVTLVVATLSYHKVEKPLRARGRARISAPVEAKPSPAEARQPVPDRQPAAAQA